VFVCYCVVTKYVGVIIMYAPLTVGSSRCLCSSVVYRSVYVDLISLSYGVVIYRVYHLNATRTIVCYGTEIKLEAAPPV
jgi:hypothetical protein